MRSDELRRACRASLVSAAALIAASTAVAQSPRLHTNESVVEEASTPTTLAVSDPLAVFAFVFASLPDRVKVYPTENYYYFSFVHAGVPYDGNIRLDASDRDRGKVHFAYAETMTDWGGETPLKYLALDAAQGVAVEKFERLVYRLGFRGKSVIFALNDLSDAKPPALAPEEKFVGPIFDESGIRFFLVFNAKLKIFHYVLDETVKVADAFVPARRTDRILVGKRTGFAFYRDHRLERKILIGVYEGNSRLNTYFDGPFDQLPDNFIEGDTFRDMLLQVEPALKGQIDRFGGSPDGAQRYMIAPYFYYARESDLAAFHTCATSKSVAPAAYYNCFVIDEASQRANRAVPLALKKAARQGRPARRR